MATMNLHSCVVPSRLPNRQCLTGESSAEEPVVSAIQSPIAQAPKQAKWSGSGCQTSNKGRDHHSWSPCSETPAKSLGTVPPHLQLNSTG